MLAFVAVLSSLLLPQAANAYPGMGSCYPVPDLWFSWDVDLDQKTLPAGVTYSKLSGGEIFFHNSGATPLIINPPHVPIKGVPVMRPLKVDSDGSFFCNTWSHPHTCEEKALVEADAVTATSPELFEAIKTGYKRADNRPASVEIPPPQPLKMKALYGDKPIIIEGTVKFSLNNKYDPNGSAKYMAACEEARRRNREQNAKPSEAPAK